jgi:hypothetical protein
MPKSGLFGVNWMSRCFPVRMDHSPASRVSSRLFHSEIPAGMVRLVLEAGNREFLVHRETAHS